MKKSTKTRTPRLEDVKFLKIGTCWQVTSPNFGNPTYILVKRVPYKYGPKVYPISIHVKAVYVQHYTMERHDLVTGFNASSPEQFTPITRDQFDMLYTIAGTYGSKL